MHYIITHFCWVSSCAVYNHMTHQTLPDELNPCIFENSSSVSPGNLMKLEEKLISVRTDFIFSIRINIFLRYTFFSIILKFYLNHSAQADEHDLQVRAPPHKHPRDHLWTMRVACGKISILLMFSILS